MPTACDVTVVKVWRQETVVRKVALFRLRFFDYAFTLILFKVCKKITWLRCKKQFNYLVQDHKYFQRMFTFVASSLMRFSDVDAWLLLRSALPVAKLQKKLILGLLSFLISSQHSIVLHENFFCNFSRFLATESCMSWSNSSGQSLT